MRDPCIDGRTILKLILKKQDMKVQEMELRGSGLEPVAGLCEYAMNL
jgi:hypothetical protein